MSTIFVLSLALVVIFWRPPFQIPDYLNKFLKPIILIIIISILLLIGSIKKSHYNNQYQSETSQTDHNNHYVKKPHVNDQLIRIELTFFRIIIMVIKFQFFSKNCRARWHLASYVILAALSFFPGNRLIYLPHFYFFPIIINKNNNDNSNYIS